MSLVFTAIVSMGILAAFFAFMLSVAHKRLQVEEDPRVEQISDILPGANCGGCGFASCHALAEAIVDGETSVNSCVAGGEEISQAISEIMGVEAKTTEKKVAFVRCGAPGSERSKRADYRGVQACRAANLVGGVINCSYGCFGYGDCREVCPFSAIRMVDGLPQVDFSRCTGCGRCVEVCPRNIIVLDSFDDLNYRVKCSSRDKGKKARQACNSSCIACRRCVRSCPYDACFMEDNLARIDPRNCQVCGVCSLVCPTGAIVEM